MKVATIFLSVILLPTVLVARSISVDALRLRSRGLAELENEQPSRAEEAFRQLVAETPEDPLPYANLAVASLRLQKFEDALAWIDTALEKAPGDPELTTIKGEVLQWSGRPAEALPIFRQAADRAPTSVQAQYALFRQASTLSGEAAESAKGKALERLQGLRPDNLVVLLQAGQRSVANGERIGATKAFLRVQEILWQAPAVATTLLDQILQSLETGDLAAARVPSLRLENVLKITPMFKEGLRELSPGIQGIPVVRFRDEPPATEFGEPLDVRFVARSLAQSPTRGDGLASGDFNGDQRADWARLTDEEDGTLEVWLAADEAAVFQRLSASGSDRLLSTDLDNDGDLDLIGYGEHAIRVFLGSGDGRFEEKTEDFGLAQTGATAATVLDFDIEGDLDLVVAGGPSGGSVGLFRNSLQGPLEPVGDKSLPALSLTEIRDLVASDLDRDGDVDLLVAHAAGLTWLDNLRQGRFSDRSREGDLSSAASPKAVASADLDNDGFPDLVVVGRGISFLHNRQGRFEPWQIGRQLRTQAEFSDLVAFDADNDGRLDLAVAGPAGMAVAAQRTGLDFELLKLENPPMGVAGLLAVDLDQDCDLDLLAAGAGGFHWLENVGGDQNRCLEVRLKGLDTGNSKNNHFGIGATLEVRSGQAYQFLEVSSDATHFGLGRLPAADLLRVVWSNGVPQNRLQVQSNQRIVEEQVLKGSCPFLYAWDGEDVSFVTDLLWGAPAGLPVAPGLWASADPRELVKVEGARAREGRYELKITEELWEAAFFDYLRLWVVDHPQEVEVASSLRILPGETIDERVLGTRHVRSVTAWTDRGLDVSERVRARDEIYASGWQESRYQGVAAEPWALTIDLGTAPGTEIRLLLDGWIFPSDASLNLAVSQRSDLETWPPRLEVETASGWQVLMPSLGYPAGKTKTMVVDTPALPPGARRLRLVATQWLSFDRIVWSTHRVDGEHLLRGRIPAAIADLHYRGFSAMYRPAPNGPHYFDYSRLQDRPPWLPFPGRYTRYGDVRELLTTDDDRLVILAPGDELSLVFDTVSLPPPPPGWSRTVFLESLGWDKDADRNTWRAQQVEPLPFRSMSGYPPLEGESPPDTESYRDYLRNWLTRVVEPIPGILPSPSISP